MAKKLTFLPIFIAMAFLLPKIGLATEYTSDSFKVVDPVLDYGGVVESSSDSFKLTAGIGQAAIGTSSSSSFQTKSGWLFFSAAAPTPAPAPAAVAAGGNFSLYLESLAKTIVPFLPPIVPKPCDIAFDLNCDKNIDLKDFSIFLAVQNRPFPNSADFNKDNKIDFKDLSILLSSWTGRLLSFSEPVPGAFLTGAVRSLPFMGEATILVFKQPTESPLVTSLAQKPTIEKSGFFKTITRFISNIFVRVKNLFKK